MTRVRVLVVAASMDILGGHAVQAQALLEGLAVRSEVQADFLPINPRLPFPFAVLQRVFVLRTIATSIVYLYRLLTTVRRYDVVHAFSASYLSYLISPLPALLVARLYGRRALLNYHSGEAADHLARWPISRWTIARVPHAVVVPSEYLVDTFARHHIPAHAIHNCIAIDRFCFRERATLQPRILSTRNLEPMYNVGAIIEAFALIQATYPDATLSIAGDGTERVRLERRAGELGLRAVHFLGRIPNAELGALYDANDVYVNASTIDNMPLSLIEAFASGVPVVTSDAGGIPYIVRNGENGVVVPDGGSADFAGRLGNAVLDLLADPERARAFTRRARAECERSYTWANVARAWCDCYTALARDDGK